MINTGIYLLRCVSEHNASSRLWPACWQRPPALTGWEPLLGAAKPAAALHRRPQKRPPPSPPCHRTPQLLSSSSTPAEPAVAGRTLLGAHPDRACLLRARSSRQSQRTSRSPAVRIECRRAAASLSHAASAVVLAGRSALPQMDGAWPMLSLAMNRSFEGWECQSMSSRTAWCGWGDLLPG